jgi:uncharacterized protein
LIVVFDSGIWISALRFGGTPFMALDHVFRNHEIAYCDPIMVEVKDILGRKFDWTAARIRDALGDYISTSSNIAIAGKLHGICRDPKDDMVLECAMLASADLIVTGDRDLLVLESYLDTQINTPRQYLETYA